MNHRSGSVTPTLLALALAACADGTPATTASSGVTRATHPELGVPLITSGAGLAERDVGWSVSAEPELVLGAVETGPEAELFSRIAGAKQRSDGTIVVVEGGYGEIRRFGPDGSHLGTTGGLGDGPEEYRRPSLMTHPSPDEVLIWDAQTLRLSRLDSDGEIAATWSIPRGEFGRQTPVMVSTNGDSMIVSAVQLAVGMDTGPINWPAHYSTFDVDTGESGRFDSVPEIQYQISRDNGASIYNVPFTHSPTDAIAFDHLIVSRSAEPEVHLYRMDGSLARVVRVDLPAEPVTRDRLLEYERSWPSAEVDEPNPVRIEMARNAPLPERVAEFDQILVDAAGHMWIRRQPRVPAPDSSRWMVFDPDDALLGTIALPAALDVYQIGSDFILGRVRNDLGVQQVVRYRLTR